MQQQQALPSRLRIHSFFSIVSYTRAAPARRRFAAGGGREDKAHYAQSAKLQLKPLTEEGALAATTQRKRRWRRHAAHAAATVLPPPTAPPRTLFKISMGCITYVFLSNICVKYNGIYKYHRGLSTLAKYHRKVVDLQFCVFISNQTYE